MQKEEKIVVVLLFMALGSLAAAFWAFSPEESYIPASGELGSGENSRSSHHSGRPDHQSREYQERRQFDLKPGFDSNARFHSRQLWGKGAISSASEGYAGEDHRNHK